MEAVTLNIPNNIEEAKYFVSTLSFCKEKALKKNETDAKS